MFASKLFFHYSQSEECFLKLKAIKNVLIDWDDVQYGTQFISFKRNLFFFERNYVQMIRVTCVRVRTSVRQWRIFARKLFFRKSFHSFYYNCWIDCISDQQLILFFTCSSSSSLFKIKKNFSLKKLILGKREEMGWH